MGGSHGGRGGNDSWSSGQQSLAAYGDAEAPTTLGQGGNGGAYGGGAFKLTVETLELNGVIEANGTSSRSGGAGGSLWLDVGTLTAAEGAMVEARGAAGTDSYGGSGGGGRIAIDYGTALDFNEQTMVSAAGGTAGNPGEDGSIVINRVPQTTRIVQTSLESLMVDSIETIDLHFATEIDPATLSASDVSLFGANLGSVSIADINALNKLVYRVTLTDPVPEGSYVLEVGPDIQTPDGLGMDQNRDGDAGTVSDVYQFSFEIDDTRPPQPVLTSHDATATIKLDGRHIVLEGKRTGEDPVAIWLDDGLRVVLGTDNWQVEQDLAEGSQSLELKAVNEAGIASEPVVLDINVDSIAPRVDGITQASHANEIPGAVGLLTTDNGSGISLADSDIQVLRDGNPVTGDLQLKNDRIEFTPATPFTEGAYQVQASVADNRGNTTPPDGQQTFDFALDTTAPNPVVLDDYPDHTTINAHNFSGQREEHATILVDGEAVQAEGDGTTWQTQVPLEEGDNTVSFRQRDRAGNVSEPVTADIFYNSEAPGPVEFQADVEGNGTTVDLAWPDYDEFENGNDIAEYRIFVESEPFDSVEGLTHEAEVPAGEKAYELGGLSRDGPSYVAVVARDIGGLMKTEVSGEPLTPVDVVSPEKPSDLQVNVGSNQLGLSWIPSEDPHDDLAGYRIRVQIDGEQVTHELANDEVSLSDGRAQYVVDGLTPATAHPLSLTAFDLADNESGALSDEGVTLLSNPDSVSAEGRDGRIALEWPASQPSELVDGYRLYVAEQPFTSVEGMDPERNVDATTLASGVAGLDNGTTYHAAVTARNLSGGENPSVDSVEVTPEEDTEGPTIEGLVYQQVDGTQVDLMDGGTITRDGTLHLKASDDSGLSRAEFRLGSEILGSSLTANPDFSIDLELFRLDDGDHTLDLRVFDNHSNETQETRPLTIDLAPPEPPVIDTPSDGHVTNNESVEIAGTADDHTQVQLTVNGTVLDANSSTSNGRFSAEVPLEEGDNSIRAQAAYSSRNEYGVHSDPIEVTLDNTVPDAPAGLSATGRAQGEVRLSWSAPDDDRIQGYHLYRSTAPFTAVAEAQRITQEKVRGERYTDLPDEDGTYHYRAVAVNELGTESDPSPSDDAVSDSEAPYVKNVEFDPEGGHDPENNRFGPGRVNLDLEFNEALETTPYLAFTVSGGNPIVVELQPDYNDEKSYKGHFVIPEDTRSGTAYGVLSARDEVGNRGSNMLDGESIVIDAQGPEVSDIVTNPVDPIRNEIGDNGEGQVIGIEMRLSEPVASGASPTLVPMLKEDAGDAIIPGYDSGLTLALDEEASTPEEPVYTTELQLPHDAGLDEQGEPGIAYLHFDYSAVDDLGTEATGIDGDPRFQVYQGDLPPTDIPEGLKARALEGGIVELSWDEVEDAAGYVVYRQGPNESELSEVTELSNPAEPLYLDGKPDGLDDGTYQYALASVRSHQGEQSRSAQSEVVEVEAMGTPPEAPEEFALELAGNGVVAQWMHPAVASSDSEVTYNLYRFALAADQPAPDLADETPLQADIPEPIAVDTEPSESEHYYVVTAVDKAGNESAPSNSDYLDSDLLPVSELAISIPEEGRPVLTWKHQNANLSGFEVGYLDSNQETVPLHDDLITETAFTDPDYADGESLSGAPKDRTYQVVAVNTDGQRSVANTLELPALSMELLDEQDSAIERGVMNRLNYRVTNAGDEEVVQARLRVGVEVDGEVREHWSKRFSVEAGDYTDVPVVIGGYEELGSHATLDAEIVLEPSPGHLLSIQQEQSAGVGQSGVRLDVETEEMVRGADGKARLVLENTSDVEMEIVTARNNGNDPSDQIRLVLKDRDGNVLSSQAAKQATGSVVTNASGDTVARIAPGDTFESQAFDVLAPMSSPEDARLHLEVDQFHHQLGRDTAVSIGGSRASSDVSLRETSYYAELESVEPQTVFTGETVTLEGRALDRDTDEPLSSVPVNLVLDVRGFERTFELQTRSDGTFSHSFTPGSGEAGSYRVSALHPSVTDRPDHGSFLVEGAGVSPTRAELEFPRNYDYRLDVKVRADKGSDLNNVRLEHAPQQDAEGNDMPLPDGLNLDLAGPLTIAGGERATLGMVISGTQQAPEQGTVRAHVMADNSEDPLDTVKVDYYLTEAKPRLQAQPTHLETGISHDGEQRETFTITNDGLESAENLSLELQDNQGNPAPDWLNLLSPSDLGNLEVDESTDIQLRLEPTSEVAEGNHEFRLRLEGDNAQALDIPVFASVTQSGEGNVLFHAVDIHTATLDEDGEPIPGLADAQITLQHQETLDETKVETDVNGEALVEDLAPGRYTYRASAFDHESTSGEIEVRPGITRREQVYLNNQLIQMEFSVKEITIEDRYDIVLESTFETDVPAPVVVFEPASVNLPMLEKGEVFQGEFTLSNHGQVEAENVNASLPEGDEYARFEYLTEIPEVLAPGQVVVVPYRITALKDFLPEADGSASGGGCVKHQYEAACDYSFECAVGTFVRNAARLLFNAVGGSSCESSTSSGGIGGGSGFVGGYGGGGGGGTTYTPRGGTPIEPKDSACEDNSCSSGSCQCSQGGGD
ncbi:fibronectin type III domain-containing protein [Halospina denitrificans]|uniref:fibronectin type III domain-containing protein n=1 Tax=Halospina denitrificans TaxID=332522 RepID=UPI001415188B|nr:fibronectin type III domain-containing protein [Halospina denitrificans]